MPYCVLMVAALSPTYCSIGAQVLQVQNRKYPLSSAILNDDRQHALLRGIEVEQPAEQQRTEVRRSWRGSEIPFLPRHIPEHDGVGAPLRLVVSRGLEASLHLVRRRAGLRQTGQIAFDVGEKYGHTDARKVIGQHLQSHGLSGAGGAGDQPVTIGQLREQHDLGTRGGSSDDKRFAHVGSPRCCISNRANSGPLPCSSCLK